MLDNNNGFQIQSPILGVVNFVVDGNGNIIISNLARNISETNQVENISDQKHSGTRQSPDQQTPESTDDTVASSAASE